MRESKPTIYDPNFIPNVLYSGVPSWLNLSILENKDELKGHDFVVMGVPWEGAATIGGYSSVSDGPKAIRSTSIRYTGYLPDFDLDFLDYLKVAEYGDVATLNGNYDFTFDSIRDKTAEILDAGAYPITLGGDHSITFPIVSEMAKRHPKKVGIVHFDAHLDNYDHYGDDEYSRCSGFYQLYKDPNMDPAKIVHVGIRGPRNHQQEFRNAQEFGANVILGREIKEDGWKKSVEKIIDILSKDCDIIYISICADVLDAAYLQQGPQDMMGLTTYELGMMVHELGLHGAKGIDFVELYPDTLSPQVAAHTANWMYLYYLNGYAEHVKNNKNK